MKTVTVRASSPYSVLIEHGILHDAGKHILDALRTPRRLCVVSDDNVAPLYLESLKRSLTNAGFEIVSFVFPHGEASKSTETLVSLLEYMAEHRLTRSDAAVALGGGVVGDLTGFASAVYQRGIPFIQIPTTLLAMVDSSVGGKTAVDLKAGKNLAGAFHQPSLVLCDPDTLSTLPDEFFSDGCAEVIKYGIINDRPFFQLLKNGIRSQLEEIIARCVENKAQVVNADEYDKGSRQLLNLGHTVGHAIEKASHMTVSHGKAVAIGMAIVMRASVRMGLCPEEDLQSLLAILKAEGLPSHTDFDALTLTDAALSDKKRSGDTLSLVLPYAIGDCRLYPISITQLSEFMENGLS